LPPKQLPHLAPGLPWNHRPPSDSTADIAQAITAKVHLSTRLLPLLAAAELVIVEPEMVNSIPQWRNDDEETIYSAEAVLTTSPMFLDFEAVDGDPVAWEAESWPLPFYLRGALCWSQEELLSIIPFGSVGGRHPWGGSDYQPWARWVYLQGHSTDWPDMGPGDFIARANGEVRSWVDADGGSICAHQGSVAYNLCRRILSVLMCLEAFEIDLVEESASRQVRRRAERKGERIGLVPRKWSLPTFEKAPAAGPAWAQDRNQGFAPEEHCPIPKTHARLSQCHLMWHEALNAYAVPDEFVGHLNALIQGLRTVTFVLKKELKHCDGFDEWYAEQEEKMKSDTRLKWLVSARNQIEKQGDLDTHSTVRVRVIGGWLEATALEMDVDPTTDAQEIARKVRVVGLSPRTRREGVLAVERRWTVEELAGDEILDVLAHCYGVLAKVVDAAHAQWGAPSAMCAFTVEGVCEGTPVTPHPSGRVPCMVASRRARTVRRDLSSGALVEMEVASRQAPEIAPDEVLERYGPPFPITDPPKDASAFGLAEAFHKWGRKMLLADGGHVTITWLLRDGRPLQQISLEPEDQREKYLAIEEIAEVVDRLGADELIFSTEAWEAVLVDEDDVRAELRLGEREDRAEVFVTYALQRGGECRVWESRMERTDHGLQLADTTTHEDSPLFLAPVVRVWEGWD
jgi:hypothetical protein